MTVAADGKDHAKTDTAMSVMTPPVAEDSDTPEHEHEHEHEQPVSNSCPTSDTHEDANDLPTQKEDTLVLPSDEACVSVSDVADTNSRTDASSSEQETPKTLTESTHETPTKPAKRAPAKRAHAAPAEPVPPTPAAAADTLAPTCWICYDSTSTEDAPLVRTCKCKGSVEHVHEACLLEWLSASESDSCVHCQHKYSLDVSYPSKMQQLLDHQNVPIAIAITVVLAVFCLFHRMFMWAKTRVAAAAQTFWAKRAGGAAPSATAGRPSLFGRSPLSPDMMTMMMSSLVPGGRMLMPVMMNGFGGQPAPRATAIRVPFLGVVEPGMLFVEMQLFVLLLVGGFMLLSWIRTKLPARETRQQRQWSPLVTPLLWCADAVDRCVDTVQQQWQSGDTPVWADWQDESMQMPQADVLNVFYKAVLQGARSVHAGFVNKTKRVRPYDDVGNAARAHPGTPPHTTPTAPPAS